MGELYDEAAHEDKKIADRWRARTNEDLTHRLSVADIDYIVGPVFRGGAKITEKQGKALILILEPSKLTTDAVKRIRRYADDADRFDRWNIVPLVSDHELKPIYKALSQDIVAQIIFKSPGTGITYAPVDYNAIARLVYEKEISVCQVRAGGFSRVATADGDYRTNKNMLVLNEMRADPTTLTILIVHEVTHAIQDWEAVGSLIHHEEADAFIAETVAARVLPRQKNHNDDNMAILDAAAQLIIDKEADENNQKWKSAYEAVVKLIASIYKKKAGLRSIPTRAKSKVFKKVVAAAEVDAWKPDEWERYQELRKQLGTGDPTYGEKVFKRWLGKNGAERLL